MDFASQKARGRGARRAKARHSGVSNADKRAGRGRGRAAVHGEGQGGEARGRSRGRGRGRGTGAEGGGGGWRSRRSKVPQGATNAWRYEESDAAASLFERRTEQGEDISRLLAEQTGAALGAVFPSRPATAGAGELDLCRLAATLSALNPAERLRLDPTLFVAGEAPVLAPDAARSAAAARQQRSKELVQRSAAAPQPVGQGRGRGRGRGRGQAEPGWSKPVPHTAEDLGSSAKTWAGPTLGRGRGRGRGTVAGEMQRVAASSSSSSSTSPQPRAKIAVSGNKGASGNDTAELDDFLDSL